MNKLEEIIKNASQAYYSNGTSDLTDAEFDQLLEQLREQDPENPLLGVGHGYDVSQVAREKFPHKYGVVGSLPKCHSFEELKSDFKYVRCNASLKLDGISVALYYEHGQLVRALKRGDGTIGIDVTAKVQKIDSTYNHINEDFTGAIRGEILMSYDNFEKFKQLHPEAKNPRNSTAGLMDAIGLDDDLKFLSIIVYTIIGDEGDVNTTLTCIRQDLKTWFGEDHVVPSHEMAYFEDDGHFEDWMDTYQEWWYGKYPADGIVITLNNVRKDNTTHEISYTAIAYKFPAEVKVSEVTGVTWEMSKFNYAIPVVNIKPLELAGTVVQNASGFNAAYIRDNNIGPGSWVEVSKHGEIIPGIDKIVSSTSAALPTHCPHCNSELSWFGVHLVCNNPNCTNVTIQDTLVWLDHICPTDFLGDKLRIKYLHEIFGEDISIEHIMSQKGKNFDRLNTSGHDKLIYNMLKKLYSDDIPIDLSDALLAVNIPRVGEITAKKLASDCPKVMRALVIGNCTDIQSQAISMVAGPATAMSIYQNYDKYKRLQYIKDRIVWWVEYATETKFSVAITGKLSVSRSQFEKELLAKGYKVGELTKDTKYLITDNPDSGSSKNAKADKLGIEKITEAQFREKFM